MEPSVAIVVAEFTQLSSRLFQFRNIYFQVKSSSAMEPFAAKSLLLNLVWDHEMPIHSITTDRSTSMRTMLE